MNNEAHTSSTTRLTAQSSCDLIQDLLPLYLENEVSENSRQLISLHLASCEQCSSYLAGARSMKAQLQRGEPQLREYAAQDNLTSQAVALGRRRLAWLLMGGLAALASIFLIAFIFLGFGSSRATTLTAPAHMPTAVPPYAGEQMVPNIMPNSEGTWLPTAVPPQAVTGFDPSAPTATPVPFQPNAAPDPQGFGPTASPFPNQ